MRCGYFDVSRGEYVVDRVDAPFSLTNYLGTGRMGAVISHNFGGYCWVDSPEHHRVTKFRPNGVPMDWPGFYVYLRDADGEYWSISWQPTGKPLDEAKYLCRHGLGYSVCECDYNGVKARQRLSIPINDTCLLADVEITNNRTEELRIDVFGYVEFSFHHIAMDNENFQMSLYASGSYYKDGAVVHELHYEPDSYQFFTTSDPDGFDGMRDAFLGAYHTEANPLAVELGRCSGSYEDGGNHCGALQKTLVIKPGETARVIFILGEGNEVQAAAARERYAPSLADAAYKELANWWRGKLDILQVKTPDENMNISLNQWNVYQAEINVLFSRFASFIEVGGRTGLGFRDTAQDAMCMPHAESDICKKRINQLLNGLTKEGYGLHLFDPKWFEEETNEFKTPTVVPTPEKTNITGDLKDVCADDALWLIPAICEYIKETGESGFAFETAPYANGGCGTVYEHMTRILEFSWAQRGENGVCKGLRADWNDCLNLGGGESAMVSFLFIWATRHFVELAHHLGRKSDADTWSSRADEMTDICRSVLWDGKWFLRGITANGKPIGSDACAEGKVHLESNAWAVLSGAATREQAVSCLNAICEHLFTKYGLILNWPCFTEIDDEVGFVTRVYPGIKENGAIFSHSNPWAWVAETMLGRGDRAYEYYKALLPENQNDIIEIRQAEPYSYCQFIMGTSHKAHGRARHPWMTGSAGWAYYAATHYMLGVRPDYDSLVVDPCVPRGWKEFSVRRVWRGAIYDIMVSNPDGAQKGVKTISLNGERVSSIPPRPEGSVNEVRIVLGD